MAKLDVVVQTFNPSSWRQSQVDLCEFKSSLIYRMRPVRTI